LAIWGRIAAIVLIARLCVPAMAGPTPDHREMIREASCAADFQITDARTAVLGGIRVLPGPMEWWSVDLLFWVAFLLVGVVSDERTEIQEARTFA
jgi:hypothetical protein